MQTLTNAMVLMQKQISELTLLRQTLSTSPSTLPSDHITTANGNGQALPNQLPADSDCSTIQLYSAAVSSGSTSVVTNAGSGAVTPQSPAKTVNVVSSRAVVEPQITTSRSSQSGSDSSNSRPRRTNAKFSMRLSKGDKDGVPMINVLKKLAVAKKIDTYDFRSKGKFAVDLFFPSCEEATDAHSRLVRSVNDDVVVGDPEMIGPRRVYFVNLPDGLDEKALLSELDERFSGLSLTDSNKFNIKIFAPRKCIKDDSKIRSTVLLSNDLYEFFMRKLNGRIPLGYYTVISVYDCIDRCIKCQSFQHTSVSCPKKVSVCGFCGKNHFTRRCPHKDNADKHHCVNCSSHPGFKDGCSGHGAVSPECPYYVQCVRNQDKY